MPLSTKVQILAHFLQYKRTNTDAFGGAQIRDLIVQEVRQVVEFYSKSDLSKYNDEYSYQLALQGED